MLKIQLLNSSDLS